MCRDFEPAPVAPDTAAILVEAATRAPSAGNTHGLDFVVLEGDRVARYWEVTLAPGRRPGFAWPGLLQAPMLLLAYVDPQAYVSRYAEPDKAASGLGGNQEQWPVPYWFVDGGAAVMAVLLQAEALGLGALLFGQFGHEGDVADAFGVPAPRRSLGTIAIGRPRAGGNSRSRSARRGRPYPSSITHLGGW